MSRADAAPSRQPALLTPRVAPPQSGCRCHCSWRLRRRRELCQRHCLAVRQSQAQTAGPPGGRHQRLAGPRVRCHKWGCWPRAPWGTGPAPLPGKPVGKGRLDSYACAKARCQVEAGEKISPACNGMLPPHAGIGACMAQRRHSPARPRSTRLQAGAAGRRRAPAAAPRCSGEGEKADE